jgi:hypothetical protein
VDAPPPHPRRCPGRLRDPEAEAERLIVEGFQPEAVGRELEPPKVILFLPAERVARLTGAREIPVRLDAELLAAPALALVRFP